MSNTSAVVGQAPPELSAAGGEASVKSTARGGRAAKSRYGLGRPGPAWPGLVVRAAGGRDVAVVKSKAEVERPCRAAGTWISIQEFSRGNGTFFQGWKPHLFEPADPTVQYSFRPKVRSYSR